MPELLLELFSEEIPARMQAQAARDLERMARERLAEAGFLPEAVASFAGPRRLTLVVEGLPPAQPDTTEERKGPRVNAPGAALDGFLRSTGLQREDLVEREGVWFASIARTGRPTVEIIAEMVGQIVREFPWPKSMKWGVGVLRWVRPLQRILCVYDGEVVPFDIEGVVSGDLSEGHRFMGSRAPFRARRFDDYAAALKADFVLLDVQERKDRILAVARTLCFARNLELVEDEGLLDEVAGLAEWPAPIMGRMDPAFLDLPPEVIRTSMRTHQRYFAVRDPGTDRLAPHFISVANIEAIDGGGAIANGNARVLSARLSDAKFFWDEDRKVPLEGRLEKLRGVTFHAKLGTMYERVERIEEYAMLIAVRVSGAAPEHAATAARLAKADLSTGMVGEFPELQGVMGRYYALSDASPEHADKNYPISERPWFYGLSSGALVAITDAIHDHYKPQGPSDSAPSEPTAIAVALADKLDSLVGFFLIDQRPTGARDPFALRRAALGCIRIILENRLRLPLASLMDLGVGIYLAQLLPAFRGHAEELGRGDAANRAAAAGKLDQLPVASRLSKLHPDFEQLLSAAKEPGRKAVASGASKSGEGWLGAMGDLCLFASLQSARLYDGHARLPREPLGGQVTGASPRWLVDLVQREVGVLVDFFRDRLKVLLREQGKRHDLVDAVFALGDDDLVRIVARVDALGAFLRTEDGANLLAGYKRATNILKAEEKKSALPSGTAEHLSGAPAEETALINALEEARPAVAHALAAEDFGAAMRSLADLRAAVDAFFDKVLVNAEAEAERNNRLKLLVQVRDAMGQMADFSLVAG